MQASLGRYSSQKTYRVSIINGREFHKCQETLKCKEKQYRRQGKGKRPNEAQAYNQTEDRRNGTLGDNNGTALTNLKFKNLTGITSMRDRQDHSDAYVEVFIISC